MSVLNPKILSWARETAGLSLEEAAQAVGINDARGITGAERLRALEAGEGTPSRPVLLKMAKRYRRPLVIFYLKEAPVKGDRGEDFRQVPGTKPPEYNPELDTLLRKIRSRQRIIRSLLVDQNSNPLPFIGSVAIKNGSGDLAARITKHLSFKLSEFRKQRSIEDAFSYLRSCLEDAGLFVLLAGNLGSYHTNISPEIFRGYAIADTIAPIIVINDQDAKAAWSFTALHETAHLWLGTTGITGALGVENRIESFCNDVAGKILLREDDLKELSSFGSLPHEELVVKASRFARDRNISRTMVAYKLYRTKVISKKEWLKLKNLFFKEWQELRKSKRAQRRDSDTGPSYYVVRRHRIGTALLELVGRSLSEGTITYTKAGQVLDVKPRNVAPLLSDMSYKGGT